MANSPEGEKLPASADKELKRANMILGQKIIIWDKARKVSNSMQADIYNANIFTLQSIWK